EAGIGLEDALARGELLECHCWETFPCSVRGTQSPDSSRSNRSIDTPTDSFELLGALGAVLGSPALAPFDAQRVERPADDVIAHARQVADAPSTNQYDAVLLKVVLFTGNVSGDFLAVGEPHAGDFAQGRVGLLGGHGLDL